MNWNDVIIGQNTIVTGEIRSVANVYIRGQIDGKLFTDQDGLILEKGLVKGSIEGSEVTINGSIEGQAKAKKITINSAGQFLGDLTANILVVEEGATFIGCSKKAEDKTGSKIKTFEPIYEL